MLAYFLTANALLIADEEGSPWITVIGIIIVGGIFLSLTMMYSRRSRNRKAEARTHNNGISKVSHMSTAQDIDLHMEEPDLDELCAQRAIRELMDEDQRRALTLFAKGAGNKELAEAMHMSPEDMTMYMNEIFARLEVNNRAELLVKLQNLAKN